MSVRPTATPFPFKDVLIYKAKELCLEDGLMHLWDWIDAHRSRLSVGLELDLDVRAGVATQALREYRPISRYDLLQVRAQGRRKIVKLEDCVIQVDLVVERLLDGRREGVRHRIGLEVKEIGPFEGQLVGEGKRPVKPADLLGAVHDVDLVGDEEITTQDNIVGQRCVTNKKLNVPVDVTGRRQLWKAHVADVDDFVEDNLRLADDGIGGVASNRARSKVGRDRSRRDVRKARATIEKTCIKNLPIA